MIPNPYSGAFLVIEGIDGCGKSEQVERLSSWISDIKNNSLVKVTKTKEPDRNSTFGRKIYADLNNPNGLHVTDPIGFQRWYSCDSRMNLRRSVLPELRLGNIIISDRFRPSMVYGARNELEIEELMRINEAIIGEDFIWPDAVFILDVTVESAIQRLKQKSRKLDGHEKIVVLARVKELYKKFKVQYPNCYLIDAEGDIDKIALKVRKIVKYILFEKQLLREGKVSG
jgi:dTMP kinase